MDVWSHKEGFHIRSEMNMCQDQSKVAPVANKVTEKRLRRREEGHLLRRMADALVLGKIQRGSDPEHRKTVGKLL